MWELPHPFKHFVTISLHTSTFLSFHSFSLHCTSSIRRLHTLSATSYSYKALSRFKHNPLLTSFHFLVPPLLCQFIADSLAHLLGVTQKHVGVALVEDRIVHACVAHGHGALHEDCVLGFPHLIHGEMEKVVLRVVHVLVQMLVNVQHTKNNVCGRVCADGQAMDYYYTHHPDSNQTVFVSSDKQWRV